VLDRLRRLFPFVVALALPLAGVVLAGARFAERDRDDGVRLLATSALGVALYALLLT
jgi:hypothetical protein